MSYPFIMPTVSYIGEGALSNLGQELKRIDTKKALLICDSGIVNAGLTKEIEAILNKEFISYDIFSEVELEPSTENVEKAAEKASSENYNILIGLGGGSSLDIAKGASVLVTNGGRIKDYMGIELIPQRGLSTILIPTTAGTGSEVTLNAIYTLKDEEVKKGVVSRFLRAEVAIVDPLLTLTCPPQVTAAAGIDALVHAIESYTAVKATLHTDMYALKAIELIGSTLRKAVFMGSDVKVRSAMSMGSFLAGVSLANAGVGAVHALAYPLGSKYHVSHGVSNALMLPYVIEFNVPASIEKYITIAKLLGEPVEGKSQYKAAALLIEAIRQLVVDTGLPQRLREVGVREEDLENLAVAASQQTRLLSNNPRAMKKEDILLIYKKAF